VLVEVLVDVVVEVVVLVLVDDVVDVLVLVLVVQVLQSAGQWFCAIMAANGLIVESQSSTVNSRHSTSLSRTPLQNRLHKCQFFWLDTATSQVKRQRESLVSPVHSPLVS